MVSNYAHIVAGGLSAGENDTGTISTYEIVDLNDLTKPSYIGSLYGIYGQIGDIHNNFILVGNKIIDISVLKSPVYVGNLKIWGTYLAGKEDLCSVLRQNALVLFDISNPLVPINLGECYVPLKSSEYFIRQYINDNLLYLLTKGVFFIFKITTTEN